MTDRRITDRPLAEPCGWRRRMASAVYESLLVVAVVFLATLLFPGAASGRLPDWGRHALALYIVVVLALYFTWFWRRGHTLAMKTWRVMVVDAAGKHLTWQRALLRYVAALVLIAPGLAGALWWREHREAVLPAGLAAVTLLTLLWPLWDRERRALYDVIAGTRLVRVLNAVPPTTSSPSPQPGRARSE